MASGRSRIAAWAAAALGLAAVLGGLERRLLAGAAAPRWDALDLHGPMQMLLADHARAGRFLLWDPWLAAGSPDFADPQTGSFSPVSIGFGLLSGGSARGFVVALGWLFSGLYVGQAEHVPILISFSWLPWVMVRLDAACAERRWLPAAQAGALWGLSALYGYPAMSFLGPAFALAWTLARAWGLRARAALAPRRVAAASAIFAAVGAVVLAPAYLGILYEAPGYSDYAGEKSRAAAIASDAFAPAAFASFASPHLPVLTLADPSLWPGTDPSMASVYAGAAPFVLAVFALLGGWRDRFRIALLLMGAGAAALAVGDALPLRGWLYDWVLPTRYFRHAALFRHYSMWCGLGLAALGSADLAHALREGDPAARRRMGVAAGGAALAALAVYAVVERRAFAPGVERTLAHAQLAAVWGGLAALAALDWAGWLPRRARVVPALWVAIALLDAAATERLSPMICDAQPAVVRRWRELDRMRSTSLDLTGAGLGRTELTTVTGPVSSIGVALKIPTLLGYQALSNRFQKRWVEEPVLADAALESADGRPRTWFAPEARSLPLDDASFERFAGRARELGAPPLVVHDRDSMLGLRAAGPTAGASPVDTDAWPAATPQPVRVLRYEPNALSLEVDAPQDGWLLVTDRWSRSWRAELDGAPVPLLGGDFLFRAVRVHAGGNRVDFSFEPPAWRALVTASWGTLAAVAALSVASGLRRRRTETGGS